MPIYLDLFLTFLKIGSVSFGGGYAMIPLVTDEVIAHGWMTATEVLNFIAVAESTPGPIAINMATFIGATEGYAQSGIWGALLGAFCATSGVVLPSFIIILVVACLIKGLLKYKGVKAVLESLRPIVVALILGTAIKMILSVIFSIEEIGAGFSFDWKALVIFAVVVATHFGYKLWRKKTISPIILIIISAGLGMLFYGVI